jgi:hypothetical protein
MQEVGGSIPPGSTSLRSLRELPLGKPTPGSHSEVSEGCRAEAGGAKADCLMHGKPPSLTSDEIRTSWTKSKG